MVTNKIIIEDQTAYKTYRLDLINMVDLELEMVQVGEQEAQLIKISAKLEENLKTSLTTCLRDKNNVFYWSLT